MTHRERVLKAVRHEEPDRVPLFYRDTPEVEQRLRRDLGLAGREELLRFFDIDFRWVGAKYVGPPLDDPAANRRRDIWGITYRYVPADAGGNWEKVFPPLAGAESPADLDAHPWPTTDWFDFSVIDRQLKDYGEYATMTAPGVDSPGILMLIQDLVGLEKAMTDMLLNPELFQALAERIVGFHREFQRRWFAVAGDRLDFYRIGDDFGTQRGLLVGPGPWRQCVQPWLRQLADLPKRHGACYYHHTCGAVRRLIPDLIETGVDVLDPLQVKAEGMDPAALKREFGARLVFSGGVDEQELLPRGAPEAVRRGVCDLLEVMAPNGGFFLGPTHNFQPDIPTANIVAMYEAARDWRRG